MHRAAGRRRCAAPPRQSPDRRRPPARVSRRCPKRPAPHRCPRGLRRPSRPKPRASACRTATDVYAVRSRPYVAPAPPPAPSDPGTTVEAERLCSWRCTVNADRGSRHYPNGRAAPLSNRGGIVAGSARNDDAAPLPPASRNRYSHTPGLSVRRTSASVDFLQQRSPLFSLHLSPSVVKLQRGRRATAATLSARRRAAMAAAPRVRCAAWSQTPPAPEVVDIAATLHGRGDPIRRVRGPRRG